MPYVEPPNSRTTERITPFGPFPSGTSVISMAQGFNRHFQLPMDLGAWLADQAVQSLSDSPYDTDADRSVGQEAIIIATRMGYITDPEYIKIVHERCVRRANQCN